MQIQSDFKLKNYNTFRIEAKAKYFAEFENISELQELLLEVKDLPKLILGGGSNILFTKDFEGIVLKNNIKGIEKINENEKHIWLKAGAGENWHQFVLYCIEQGYAGIENLSLIPGTVGAAPMQNIGAYGVEIKEVIDHVEALSIENGSLQRFTNQECEFGYRESIFKHKVKNQFIITEVLLRLNKKPKFNISYGAIATTLKEKGIQELSIKAISEAVCFIRSTKLPNPTEIGNAGSFFKNPEIPREQFDNLQEKFPQIVYYPVSEKLVKVPAAWLIEQAGWKGKRFGDVGVHQNQALVLVNYGKGKGQEIKDLAEKIHTSVKEKFSITLKPEINII